MIDTFARIAFLRKIHLFSDLDDDELETIAEEMDELSVPVGGVVFEQEGKSEGFYLIYRGGVRIIRKKEGKEIQLAVLQSHDYFGEMGLISRRRRSGTVTATSDTILLVLMRADFEHFFKKTPQLRLNMDVAIRSRQLARSLHFKWLRKDEVIYFLARKHHMILYEKLIVPVLAIFIPAALFYSWIVVIHYSIVAFAAFLSLFAWVGWIIWVVVDWGNDYYIVTNQRVVWLEKVVGIYDSRQESPISTILGVDVETGQIGRIFNYGNVVMRTYVGKIRFDNVSHPDQAAHMIEEYWYRTKDVASGLEKDAMKNAIRKRLGLPIPTKPDPFYVPPAPPEPRPQTTSAILKFLGAHTLKLRYEMGDHVIYRKHWVVLFIQARTAVLGTLGTLLLLVYRLFQLVFDSSQSLITHNGGFPIDTWVVVFFLSFFPFVVWFVYEVLDWSNDKFEVTNEQIIDIDRTPWGKESRNAAQLENILGTNYVRNGFWANIFNFGTVYITVGGSKLAFEDVMDPAAVQSDIDRRRMARSAKQNEAKISVERDRMAEWLATYHKSAQDFYAEEKRNNKKAE